MTSLLSNAEHMILFEKWPLNSRIRYSEILIFRDDTEFKAFLVFRKRISNIMQIILLRILSRSG